MHPDTFQEFLSDLLTRTARTLTAKNDDYASSADKLSNFHQAARIDKITPVEALRGMWLKHRCSVTQGLDEMEAGKAPRPLDWWREKLGDDRNYNILLEALLVETLLHDHSTNVSTKDRGEELDFEGRPVLRIYWAHPYLVRDLEAKTLARLRQALPEGVELLNPFDRETDDLPAHEIVAMDLGLISTSDLVVAYLPSVRSFGTIMEIAYAFIAKKPIWIRTKEENWAHPWLSAHASKFLKVTTDPLPHIYTYFRSLTDGEVPESPKAEDTRGTSTE